MCRGLSSCHVNLQITPPQSNWVKMYVFAFTPKSSLCRDVIFCYHLYLDFSTNTTVCFTVWNTSLRREQKNYESLFQSCIMCSKLICHNTTRSAHRINRSHTNYCDKVLLLSQKNSQDNFSRNLKKHCQIFNFRNVWHTYYRKAKQSVDIVVSHHT